VSGGGDWEDLSTAQDWERPAVGSRVLLLEPHPWAGYTGVVERHATVMGLKTIEVRIDRRDNVCGVMDRKDILEIPA